jgi:hypothetical protein
MSHCDPKILGAIRGNLTRYAAKRSFFPKLAAFLISCVFFTLLYGWHFDWFKVPSGTYHHERIQSPSITKFTKLDFRSDGNVVIEEYERVSGPSGITLNHKRQEHTFKWKNHRGRILVGYFSSGDVMFVPDVFPKALRFEGGDLLEDDINGRRFTVAYGKLLAK